MPLIPSALSAPVKSIGRRRDRIVCAIAAAVVGGILGASASPAGASLYWDVNGPGTGAVTPGATPANGTWGVDSFWSTSPTGNTATGAWVNGETAVFSAGTGVSGGLATGQNSIAVSGTQSAGNLTFEEGTNTLTGGTIVLQGAGIAPGIIQLSTTNTQLINSVLDGANGITVQRLGTIFSGAVSLNAANTFIGPLTVSSGRLNLNANGAASSGGIFLNAGTQLNSTTIPNSIITVANTVTLNPGSGADIASNPTIFLNIIGKVTGAGNWTHGPSGAVPQGTLTLSNSLNDFTGSLSVGAGTVLVTNDHALGNVGVSTPTTALNVGNTGITGVGQVAFQSTSAMTYTANEQLIILSGTTTGSVSINNLGGDNTFTGGVQFNQATLNTIGVDSGSLTLSGQVIAGGAGNKNFSKTGPGALILSGETTTGFNAAVTVNGGSLVLGGTTATAGDIANATSATVNAGSLLHLDNTLGNNQDRLGNTAAVNLNGSALLLSGNSSEASAEQFGNLTINPGEHFVSTMTINPAAGQSASLNGGTFGRSSGSLVVFRAPDLGAPLAASRQIKFTTTPQLIGGGGSGVDKSIIMGALGDFSTTGNGTDFVTYDSSNGVTPLAPGDYATSITSGTTILNNVAISTQQNVSFGTVINSLKIAGGGGVNIDGGSFIVNTGMILAAASSNSGITGPGTLGFQTDAIVAGPGDLNISANIGAPNAFVKAGSGRLLLSGTNSIGSMYISGGTLAPATSDALGSNNDIHVGGDGTLELADGMNLTSSNLFLHDGGRLLGHRNSSYSRPDYPLISANANVILEAADANGTLSIGSAFKSTGTSLTRPTISLRGPGTVDFVSPTPTFFANYELRNGVHMPLSESFQALGNVDNKLIFGPGGGTVHMHSLLGGTNWGNPVVINGNATFLDESANGNDRFGSLTVNADATIRQVLPFGNNFIHPTITFGDTALNGSPTFDIPRPPIADDYGYVHISNVREFGGQRGITKNGEGILAIHGSFGFTGHLAVNNGIVLMDNFTDVPQGTFVTEVPTISGISGGGILQGSVNVRSGGDISPGFNGVGDLLVEGITINGTDVNQAQIHLEGDATGFDKLAVFGPERLHINGPAVIDLTNLGGLTNGDYVIIDYLNTPLSDADFGKLSLASPSFGAFTASLVNDTADTQVKLHLEGGPDPGTWNINADGSWNLADNWNPVSVPDAATASANFLQKITAPRTITLDGDRHVAQLVFGNANSYTIAPGTGGTLSLGDVTHNAVLNVTEGSHFITAPLALAGNTIMNIGAGSTLTSSGGFSIGEGKVTTLRGAGTLAISGPQSHGVGARLAVNAGQLNLNSNAGTPATASTAASANLEISISNTDAKVILGADQDLASIRLDVSSMGNQSFDLNSPADAGAFRSVRIYAEDVATAKSSLYGTIRNANAPLVPSATDGIYDSGLSAHAASKLGIAALIDAHGEPYVLIRPTRVGDLNMDGSVTIADFIDLAAHFNQAGPDITWQEGDINYDGAVTIADFIDLAGNFNSSYSGQVSPISAADQLTLSSFAASVGASAVPEPAMIGLLGVAAALLPRRRRRR